MEIKIMTEEHVDGVGEIEQLCFSQPWSKNSLMMLTKEGAVACVALEDGRVAAYGGMMTVLDEGQITNIATHPDFRRRGYARAVTEALSQLGRERGLEGIYLEVRRSNQAAISLYHTCGYTVIGERRGFYSNPTEDALLMKKALGEE